MKNLVNKVIEDITIFYGYIFLLCFLSHFDILQTFVGKVTIKNER